MMKIKFASAAVGCLVAMLTIFLLAATERVSGQVAPATPPAMKEAEKPAAPEMKEHMAKMKEMAGKMKASPATMMGCCMLMRMEVKADDPGALLALKEHLKLTPDQLEQLKKIVAQAREDAGKVLTDEQKKQLEPIAKTARSMMEMHHDMMQKMGYKMTGHQKGPAMMCPLMKAMEAMEHKEGVKEEEEPAEQEMK